MSPKREKKFLKFSNFKKGKLHNGVHCSCLQCGTGYQSNKFMRYKIGRELKSSNVSEDQQSH